MKLLAFAALATLAAAELSPCITQCAQNVTAANATACPSKNFESAECLCEYGFTSTVRKCMYTGCMTEVNDWVAIYRGAQCPEGTYSSNTSNPHSSGNSSMSMGASASQSGSAAASGAAAAASSPAASPSGTSAAMALGVPVMGAAIAAAVVAAL
ncbi:hypothetical protein CC85DRAFT_285541 [Cutaneotrichosporon oleaginosum]|uniref:CFEM domain-containing protein n=1 Tax=Cutaneotrichosporon oleaginosum TaxID=879819 RepID=A0A0J0XN10_9TREE|nr:uncharacterized protein CC85DRAFT_285541 [Cutaneotrichosporon oleaginosum]KLT42458.1 hypothetical protein CC85DRAFT_285541 [Cutaneotrichosporon oleaginosum]TXT06977.1 hypothetical protein COLE_06308 [Cutaneotrichosporon oleaginosum]